MKSSLLSPGFELTETSDGVRYILRNSGYGQSNISLGLVFVLRVPLVAAGLAVWFLSQHFRQISPLLTGLAVLFVAQMGFVARLPWNLFRQNLWQQLIARFGHGEIELIGDRLFSGNRVGFFRSAQHREIGEFQRLVVYVYEDTSAPLADREATVSGNLENGNGRPQTEEIRDGSTNDGAAVLASSNDVSAVGVQQYLPRTERAVLAMETTTKSPWLLVDGFSRSETLALAEDLHRRIAVRTARHSSQSPLPEPVVIETHQRVLYPPLPPDFYRRRKPLWLGIHLAGSIGLAALTAVAIKAGVWPISSTKFAILLGWLLEVLLVATTLFLPGASETESTSA